MSTPTNHSPRRYFVDPHGQRVLIGLTREETAEFERLESEPLSTASGSEDGCSWRTTAESRRLELYGKHEGAWKAWMAQSRVERREVFKLC